MKRKTLYIEDNVEGIMKEISTNTGLSIVQIVQMLLNEETLSKLSEQLPKLSEQYVNSSSDTKTKTNLTNIINEELSVVDNKIVNSNHDENIEELDELIDLEDDEPIQEVKEQIQEIKEVEVPTTTQKQIINSVSSNPINSTPTPNIGGNIPTPQFVAPIQPTIPKSNIVAFANRPVASVPKELIEEEKQKQLEREKQEAERRQREIEEEEERERKNREFEEEREKQIKVDKALDFINNTLEAADYNEDENEFVIYEDTEEYNELKELEPYFKYIQSSQLQRFNNIVKIKPKKIEKEIVNEPKEYSELDFLEVDEEEEREYMKNYARRNNPVVKEEIITHEEYNDEEEYEEARPQRSSDVEVLTNKQQKNKKRILRWKNEMLQYSKDDPYVIVEGTDEYEEYMKYRNSKSAQKWIKKGTLRIIDSLVEIRYSDEDYDDEEGYEDDYDERAFDEQVKEKRKSLNQDKDFDSEYYNRKFDEEYGDDPEDEMYNLEDFDNDDYDDDDDITL